MGVNYPAQDFNHFYACGVSACLSLSCTASVRLVSLLSPVNPSSPSPPSPRVPSFFSCNVAPLVNLQMPAPMGHGQQIVLLAPLVMPPLWGTPVRVEMKPVRVETKPVRVETKPVRVERAFSNLQTWFHS